MKLIKGSELTTQQLRMVKAAFVHRNTVEEPFPAAGGSGADTDEQWIKAHSFYITKTGELASKRAAQPEWLADIG